MTEIMPVPRNLILLSYQQRAFAVLFLLKKASQSFTRKGYAASVKRQSC